MKKVIFILVLCSIATSKMKWLGDVGNPGARYPIFDVYDGGQNPSKKGQLNSVGMRQQYLLGTYLRADYINKQQLISGKFYHKSIEAFACVNVDRTYDSALSRLYGVFPPGSGWTIPSSVTSDKLVPPFISDYSYQGLHTRVGQLQFALQNGFQPVPIWPLDEYLNDPCPNAGIIKTKRLKDIAKNLTNMQRDHAAFFAKVKLVFNLTSIQTNLPTMAELYDTVMSDLTLGKQLPNQFDASDLKTLKYLSDYYTALLNGDTYAETFSTLLLSLLKLKTDQIISGKLGQKKWSLFFPKQGAIAPLLYVLSMTSPECLTQRWRNQTITSLNCVDPPAFSTNFLMQLHEDDAFEHFIKIKYNGQYVNLCGIRSTTCEYKEFWQRINIDMTKYTTACYAKR